MESPYLTSAEVARYVRVDPATVRRWCTDGTLAAIKVGKGFRVRRIDLEAFLGQPVPR